MMFIVLAALDFLLASLLQQQERTAYLKYLLLNSIEVKS